MECLGLTQVKGKQKIELMIHCDLVRILQSKDAYVIQFSFSWKNHQPFLDHLMTAYLGDDYYNAECTTNPPRSYQTQSRFRYLAAQQAHASALHHCHQYDCS
jgi:hypothetical protein